MSSSSITDQLNVPASLSERSLSELVTNPLQRVAFYAAIVLPFVHLPLLVSGLPSETITLAFAVLLVLNVMAIFVGHYYER